jgi:deazaflavin-dependent oxidoreductase (nitroreductase family)
MVARALGAEAVCYLTTTGRVTGRSHTIEIWFALHQDTIYLLAGGGDRADWVRNLRQTPAVTVRLGGSAFSGQGRVVTDPGEDRLARDLVYGKYQPGYGGDLSRWRAAALPVAVDLEPPRPHPRATQ